VINKVLKITYGHDFPFEPPKVTFDLKAGGDSNKYARCYCLFDLEKLNLYDII